MNSTPVPRRAAQSRRATLSPSRPGITTSVRSRSIGSPQRAAISSARVAIRGLEDRVAAALEQPAGASPDRLVVLDQKDRLGAAHRRHPAPRRVGGDLAGRNGQVHGEARAAARHAVDGDRSARLGDDVPHGRQAQAGAVALVLGGVEGLEDAGEIAGVDAHPVVGDGQRGVPARGRVARDGIALLDLDDVRRELDTTSVRHRLAGVDRQVHDDLLEPVAHHVGEARPGAEPDVVHHVLADERLQHRRPRPPRSR